jgi:hypothetical protein
MPSSACGAECNGGSAYEKASGVSGDPFLDDRRDFVAPFPAF